MLLLRSILVQLYLIYMPRIIRVSAPCSRFTPTYLYATHLETNIRRFPSFDDRARQRFGRYITDGQCANFGRKILCHHVNILSIAQVVDTSKNAGLLRHGALTMYLRRTEDALSCQFRYCSTFKPDKHGTKNSAIFWKQNVLLFSICTREYTIRTDSSRPPCCDWNRKCSAVQTNRRSKP